MSLTPVEKKSRLLEYSGDLPRPEIERHFQRLDNDYWNEFPVEEIHQHISVLRTLSPTQSHSVRIENLEGGLCGLTLIGGNFAGFFSAVSGFLASSGYDIHAGKAFSFLPEAVLPALPQGGIIDFLLLDRTDGPCSEPAEQARLQSEMENLFRRFEAGEAAGVRTELYRRIGGKLEQRRGLEKSVVPLEIQCHVLNTGTQVAVRGRDREAMLFCISGALTLQGLSIEKLLTQTHEDGSFEDRITVTGPARQPIRNAKDLEKIRTGIALMERLLETLPAATDLQAAAEGLQALVEDWLEESNALTEKEGPEALPALSRVLTAGSHMWDMVNRLGPKSFRQMLTELTMEHDAPSREHHLSALKKIEPTETESESLFSKVRAYRERELLKAELDLLLTSTRDLNEFSDRLNALAEGLLIFCIELLWKGLAKQYGIPCPWALFALGKFGGQEMGSGSDLEILLVYANTGETTGPEKASYGELYQRLCEQLLRALETRPGETLALDFRLRPHGDSGPLAASFPAWREYFSAKDKALDYEKQALIRLRPVYGSEDLTQKILSARDEIVYANPPVSIAHTLELHAQQTALKTKPGTWNAKYSEGGMAELEYSVQFLQLAHGNSKPSLRQHNIARALETLLESGILTLSEFENLYTSRLFLRRLINALRLVRGQAGDLHCPFPASPEFSFLAKRMGYVQRQGITAESQLDRDIQQSRRVVGGFFRSRFLGAEKPEWLYESLSETLMDSEASLEEASPALLRLGMRDLQRSRRLFLELFEGLVEKRLAAACILMFEDHFRHSPDPEGVLRKLNRYLEGLTYPDVFIRQALHHPPLMEMLLLVFANSDMLSDLAMRESAEFKSLVEPENLEQPRTPELFHHLAVTASVNPDWGVDAAARLCRFRNREYLRIALRDLRLGIPLREITYEISGLTDALVNAAFDCVLENLNLRGSKIPMSVLALGKLGGLELNYSSDIDLVFVLEDSAFETGGREAWEQAGRELIGFLTGDTSEGRLFRVDMNLRPWGGQGPLVATFSQCRNYFAHEAAGWELQAWLKARSVCGNLELGKSLVQFVQQIACATENAEKVEESMRKVRLLGLDKLHRNSQLAGEVKLGPGGIRTVEFFTQALQIRHAAQIPELLTGNTLEALGRLNRYGLLPYGQFQLLTAAYVFLRRVEHRLQLQALQQRHALPTDSVELHHLARQMGFEDRIGQTAVAGFLEQYRKHMLSLQSVSAELFTH